MVQLDIGTRPANLPPEKEILGVMVQYVEGYLKRSDTLPCSMLYKFLMVMGELDICIRPDLLPPIIQFILLYRQVL